MQDDILIRHMNACRDETPDRNKRMQTLGQNLPALGAAFQVVVVDYKYKYAPVRRATMQWFALCVVCAQDEVTATVQGDS